MNNLDFQAGNNEGEVMDDIIAALQTNYQIEAITIERIDYGLWEENYKVESEHHTYFVKRFWAKWRLRDRYTQMLEGIKLGQALREKGIPAPLHLSDKEGNLLSKYGDDTYQVNAWIEGITYRPGSVPDKVAYSMGKLLGQLHKLLNCEQREEAITLFDIDEAIQSKLALLTKYKSVDFDGKEELIAVIQNQLNHLEALKEVGHDIQLFNAQKGIVYNSFWIEQLIFSENHEVRALIDWTDGAGGEGFLVQDIDTAFLVSAFDLNGIVHFSRGYQSVYKLSQSEWQQIICYTCTRHLATNWIYESWYNQISNRFDHWKTTARKWLYGIEYRYTNKALIEEMVLRAIDN